MKTPELDAFRADVRRAAQIVVGDLVEKFADWEPADRRALLIVYGQEFRKLIEAEIAAIPPPPSPPVLIDRHWIEDA